MFTPKKGQGVALGLDKILLRLFNHNKVVSQWQYTNTSSPWWHKSESDIIANCTHPNIHYVWPAALTRHTLQNKNEYIIPLDSYLFQLHFSESNSTCLLCSPLGYDFPQYRVSEWLSLCKYGSIPSWEDQQCCHCLPRAETTSPFGLLLYLTDNTAVLTDWLQEYFLSKKEHVFSMYQTWIFFTVQWRQRDIFSLLFSHHSLSGSGL